MCCSVLLVSLFSSFHYGVEFPRGFYGSTGTWRVMRSSNRVPVFFNVPTKPSGFITAWVTICKYLTDSKHEVISRKNLKTSKKLDFPEALVLTRKARLPSSISAVLKLRQFLSDTCETIMLASLLIHKMTG